MPILCAVQEEPSVGGSTDSGLPESAEPDFGVELKVSGSHDFD
jgi:hypothetical protein